MKLQKKLIHQSPLTLMFLILHEKSFIFVHTEFLDEGESCWSKCEAWGPCPWCGTDGACCRKGYTTADGCDGTNGGDTQAECTKMSSSTGKSMPN